MIKHSAPTIGEQEIAACENVLRSGQIAQGKEVAAFEEECATFVGRKYGIAVSSGTAAIKLALDILDIPPEQYVAIPAFSCVAPATAVIHHGALPYLCDCQPEFLVGLHQFPKNHPAIVIHLFGALAPVPKSQLVIEDIAQAIGGPAGKEGKVAVVSFYATKLLTTGEGGMILVDDYALAEKARDLREYDKRDDFKPRFNFKMTDFQAAIGRVQLKRLPQFIDRRREIAARYSEAFQGLPVKVPSADDHVFFRYVITLDNRDELQRFLATKGIETKCPIYRPLHHYSFGEGFNCPNADYAFQKSLSLPIYPSLSDEEVAEVISALCQFFAA